MLLRLSFKCCLCCMLCVLRLFFSINLLHSPALRLQWKLADWASGHSSGSVHQWYEGDLEATADHPDPEKVTLSISRNKQNTPAAAALTGRNSTETGATDRTTEVTEVFQLMLIISAGWISWNRGDFSFGMAAHNVNPFFLTLLQSFCKISHMKRQSRPTSTWEGSAAYRK